MILHDGMKKMYEQQQNVFYYVTVMNENYIQPVMPEGVEDGIIRGMYLYRQGSRKKKRVQLLGSGTILREVIAAAALLEDEWNIAADVGASPASASCVARHRYRALEHAAPDGQAAGAALSPSIEGQKGRWLQRPTTSAAFRNRSCRTSVTSPLSRWAPMVLAIGPAFPAAQVLRGEPPLRGGGRTQGAGRQRRVDASLVAQAIKAYKIDPEKPNPHLSE